MADVKPRVFISAVTGEFESARNAVAADLRARGCEVTVQSDFKQGPDSVTLLRTLYDYIRDCHSVVCLIGERTGAFPPPGSAKHFKSERFKDALPSGMTEASFTQWEFLFARYFGRRVYTYRATDMWTPDKAGPSDDRQAAFIQFLKDQDVHWTTFSTIDQLARAVLKEDFSITELPPKPATGKPIVLPYPSLGPLFKGRDGFMQQLHDSLSRGGQAAITSKALYGLGGIGKTRAAVEYAWAHREDYTALLFVVAESPEALRRNLAALAATLVPDLDTTGDTVRLQSVLDWLAANPGWFLILDNVDTKNALAEAEDLLKRLSGGQVVLTSRLADFSANFKPISLDVLTPKDAAAFLLERTEERRRAKPDDEAMVREIAAVLGGLALGLEQAGAYIAKHRLTFADYLDRWRSSDRSKVLDWFDSTVTEYPRSVAVTWQTSVAQLTERGRHLLECLSWLAPEKVPEFLLDVPILDAKTEDSHEALADLATYSLVTRDAEGPYFLVHRLVQHVTRRSLTGERRQERLMEALGWIHASFPENPYEFRSWPRAEPLESHARAVIANADDADISAPTAQLMHDLGTLLFSKARYAEAEPLYLRSLEIAEQALDNDHTYVATTLNDLALLYRTQGRYTEAEPLYQRAMTIYENKLGKDSLHVGTSLNNLGTLYRMQQRYEEAKPLLQRAVAIRETILGPDDSDVAASLNNLAQLYSLQGHHADAEPLYRRSLVIRERALSKDDPSIAVALNNLAGFYDSQGRHDEAKPLLERALAIREKALGPQHPDLATSLNNLAELYRTLGHDSEAESLYQRAIDIFSTSSRQMGRLHPNLKIAVNNYTLFLADKGKADAEVEAERERLMRWQD